MRHSRPRAPPQAIYKTLAEGLSELTHDRGRAQAPVGWSPTSGTKNVWDFQVHSQTFLEARNGLEMNWRMAKGGGTKGGI